MKNKLTMYFGMLLIMFVGGLAHAFELKEELSINLPGLKIKSIPNKLLTQVMKNRQRKDKISPTNEVTGSFFYGNPLPLSGTVSRSTIFSSQQDITGIVIDARGYAVKSAFVPKIFDIKTDEVVYSENSLRGDVWQGVVYVSSPIEAFSHIQINDSMSPLFIKMLALADNQKDIYISHKDALRLKELADYSHVISRGKVVIWK